MILFCFYIGSYISICILLAFVLPNRTSFNTSMPSYMYTCMYIFTVWLVILVGLIFRDLGSSDDFMVYIFMA